MAVCSTTIRQWIILICCMVFGQFTPVRLVLANNKVQRLRKKNVNLSVNDIDIDHSILPTRRKLDFDQDQVDHFHPGEPSAGFVKCNSILDQSTGDDSSLDEAEYLVFLNLLTDGEINSASFDDLDDAYRTFFYQAACASDIQCDGGNGYIEIGGTLDAVKIVMDFCGEVMRYVRTRTSISFGYSIRYNADTITKDALNGCLEKATTNLLLDNFGCETQLGDEKRQRRQLSLRGVASKVKSLKPKVVSEEERLFSELLIRNEEDVRFLSSGMSLEEPKPSSCRFDIEVQVPNVINLGCVPPALEGSNVNCGLVRSSVAVAAPQELYPFASQLRQNITQVLRVAIDGDTFEDFFPEECLSSRRLLA